MGDRDELSVGLLEGLESTHVVPEAALCNNLVGGEDHHAVDLWVWFSLSWEFTT